MPSLTAILYCFRGIDDYGYVLSKISGRDHDEDILRFENIVLSLTSIINPISWKQWKDAASEVKNYPFLKALEAYEVNGEPFVGGSDNIVDISGSYIIDGGTNAEWAWALGMPDHCIVHFATHFAMIGPIHKYLIDVKLTEKIINRAYVRLKKYPIPFPVVEN